MSIDAERYQEFYARLLVSHEFRAALRDSPAEAGGRFGLSDEEISYFRSLDPVSLHIAITSIAETRLQLIGRALPTTMQALRSTDGSDTIVQDYVSEHPPVLRASDQVENRLLSEAERFVEFLRDEQPAGVPAFISDLASYEQARLALRFDASAGPSASACRRAARREFRQLADPRTLGSLKLKLGTHVRLLRLDHDVLNWPAQTTAPGERPACRITYVIIQRMAGRANTRVYRTGVASFNLLRILDGTRPVADICRIQEVSGRAALSYREVSIVRTALREGLLFVADAS